MSVKPHETDFAQPSKRRCAKPATSRYVETCPKGPDSSGRSGAHINSRSNVLGAWSSGVDYLRPQC